ncbi:MAG: sigma-70 family RNA polymerase sigma factor [Candidatus Izemoplasma sp.]|nr:sigma-70 family RNA polymerase sigma factor [Candidatus Izemoplasma sp.]
MTIYKHNDFKIIDQIREGNNDALELMFEKYSPLISKKIGYYNLAYMYDDMVQEAYMMLHKSILTYDTSYNKTFTRYFEQNLDRMYITYINKQVRRTEIFYENVDYIFEHNHHTQDKSVYYDLYKKEIENILTNREFSIYILKEIKNYSVDYICKRLEIPEKVVYNSVYRAKQKIKAHFGM